MATLLPESGESDELSSLIRHNYLTLLSRGFFYKRLAANEGDKTEVSLCVETVLQDATGREASLIGTSLNAVLVYLATQQTTN